MNPIQAISLQDPWAAWAQALQQSEAALATASGATPEVQGSPAVPAMSASTEAATPAQEPLAAPTEGTATEARLALLPGLPVLLRPLHAPAESRVPAWPWPELERLLAQDDEAKDAADAADSAALSAQPDGATSPAFDEGGDGDPTEPLPAWLPALLQGLRRAAQAPQSAAALRALLRSWHAGRPALLACPSGLLALQPGKTWHWRRWSAQWHLSRPMPNEHWWALRLGLDPQGRPQPLRELAGAEAPLDPGRVSCELRLHGQAAQLARWRSVLVQAAAAPSLLALLRQGPLTWLLCTTRLWPGA
ncbi:hypothetical protein RQP53_16865 [Paucibacter sp. APW11]|uniref:GspL cytoplasmic actin-ATPase-like domain-containing protein n=1 Tax=Roseateles aquae TaxID=3077235 RepID=A0ABU3PEA7_9BURK|nr:hypothetical protein [Paucibacter sp. APW11]MDT9000951.1 hypothetical protein [Paucibacter sp. APW11]